jgi:hypothetical protein
MAMNDWYDCVGIRSDSDWLLNINDVYNSLAWLEIILSNSVFQALVNIIYLEFPAIDFFNLFLVNITESENPNYNTDWISGVNIL